VRSLRNVQSVDVGLDRDHLLVLDVDMSARGYNGQRLANLVQTLRERIASLPGVVAVAYSENGIFSGVESSTAVQIPGFVARELTDTIVAYDLIGSGYVSGIGGRLVAGRELTPSDEQRGPRVALINAAAAQFYFPNGSAVGKFLHFQDSIAVEILGVVANVRDHELDGKPTRRVYFPYLRSDSALGYPGSLFFEIRTSGDPASLVQRVRQTVVGVDPTLPIDGLTPVHALMRQSIREERLVATLATSFGVLALVLAGIGLYGVMTYAITRRTGEIGLRVALGAQRNDVLWMVLAEALRVVGVGVLVGLPLAIASARLLRTQLHDVGAFDMTSLLAAVAVLIVSAVVAVLLPAMRASRVSPIVALRAD
jgi:putative ABC transport system permease protein